MASQENDGIERKNTQAELDSLEELVRQLNAADKRYQKRTATQGTPRHSVRGGKGQRGKGGKAGGRGKGGDGGGGGGG